MTALPLSSGDGRLVVSTTIVGDPFPAQRPRFARQTGHTYMPRETTDAIRALREALRKRCPIAETSFDVEVWLTFRRATHGRVDVDNLAKTVLDACKGIVWKDDSQVVSLHVVKMTGCGRDASTTIAVRRMVYGETVAQAQEVEE